MKYIISFFISLNTMASPIHLYNETNIHEISIYRDILMTEYNIPEELISIHKTQNCDEERGFGKLDLCLKKNGDLVVVSADSSFINESLKVFRSVEEKQ